MFDAILMLNTSNLYGYLKDILDSSIGNFSSDFKVATVLDTDEIYEYGIKTAFISLLELNNVDRLYFHNDLYDLFYCQLLEPYFLNGVMTLINNHRLQYLQHKHVKFLITEHEILISYNSKR